MWLCVFSSRMWNNAVWCSNRSWWLSISWTCRCDREEQHFDTYPDGWCHSKWHSYGESLQNWETEVHFECHHMKSYLSCSTISVRFTRLWLDSHRTKRKWVHCLEKYWLPLLWIRWERLPFRRWDVMHMRNCVTYNDVCAKCLLVTYDIVLPVCIGWRCRLCLCDRPRFSHGFVAMHWTTDDHAELLVERPYDSHICLHRDWNGFWCKLKIVLSHTYEWHVCLISMLLWNCKTCVCYLLLIQNIPDVVGTPDVQKLLYAPVMTFDEAAKHSEKDRVSVKGRVKAVRDIMDIYFSYIT